MMSDQIVGAAVDPTDNDKLVLTFLDNTGTPSRYEADLTPWAGTPANLADPTGLPSSGITVDAGGQVTGTGDGVTTPLLLNLDPAVSLSDLAAPTAALTINGRLAGVVASADSDAPNFGQVKTLPGRIIAEATTIAGLGPTSGNTGHYGILTAIDGTNPVGLYQVDTGVWALRMAAGTGSSGPWLDVTDYGASTGRTDNEVPINAAIQALPATGGVVYIPEWFEVSAPVVVDSDAVMLVGAGWSDFLTLPGLPATGSGLYAGNAFVGTEVVSFKSTNVDNRPLLGAGMRDLMVEGPALNAAPTANVVGIRARVARGNFDRVYTNRCTSHGLMLQGASIALGDGVDWSTYDTNVTNCQSSHNDGDGLHLGAASADTKINNMQAFNNDGDGIAVLGASHQLDGGHVYENRNNIVVRSVRCHIGNMKNEDAREHGVHAVSDSVAGHFVGGLVIDGSCTFRNNGTSAANTFDDVRIESDQSDGPWKVNARFSGGPSTPRYAINPSPLMNQGLISGCTTEGTYGTALVNTADLGVAAGAFANRQVGNAVAFNDPAPAGGTAATVAYYKHSSGPTDTFVNGDRATFALQTESNNGAGDISLNGATDTIQLAADTGWYEIWINVDTEAPANGDVTSVTAIVDGAGFAIGDVSLDSNQLMSWFVPIDTTGAAKTFEVNRAVVTGTGRLDVQVRVLGLD